jgi:pimeloyl-ACP methyl ester carboxylesterase
MPRPRSPERSDPAEAAGHSITRRRFAGVAGAALAAGLAPGGPQAFAAGGRGAGPFRSRWQSPRPPHLPAGFARTFSSRFVNAGGLRQHAVTGGNGPPLLLVHGWPENWYAWRLVMPALARDYEVIAVDQRGIGLTAKPKEGYDTATLANDLVALMDALGHRRFAVVGHDTGFAVSYALAADHPDRVERVALAEIPGPPLRAHAPSVFEVAPLNNRVWHLAVNRLEGVNEQLIRGREDIYFGYELAIQAGTPLPAQVVDYYVRLVSNRESLRGSLGFYRALDATIEQNERRATRALSMPVLTIAGAASFGPLVGEAMSHLATDVQSVVIPGAGHWVAEEAPKEMLTALNTFLAPAEEES